MTKLIKWIKTPVVPLMICWLGGREEQCQICWLKMAIIFVIFGLIIAFA